MTKDFSLLIFEGIIVGVGLTLLYIMINSFLSFYSVSQYTILFLSGLSFHLLCEFTGINKWYSLKYCELLRK